jgi:cytochrome c oxidase cbb3-type subunit 4
MEIDSINFWRTIVTLVSFILFIGVTIWAWSARNRERFNEAAQLPFEGE